MAINRELAGYDEESTFEILRSSTTIFVMLIDAMSGVAANMYGRTEHIGKFKNYPHERAQRRTASAVQDGKRVNESSYKVGFSRARRHNGDTNQRPIV